MSKDLLTICNDCGLKCKFPCAAARKLFEIYNERRARQKNYLIGLIRQQLDLIDFELAPNTRILADKIITTKSELSHIKEFDIKIDFIRSYEAKKSNQRLVYADCRKVTGPYQVYLPYEFLITEYEPNKALLTDNQFKLVIYHELRHIGMGPKGSFLIPHEIEDFESILNTYGLRWNNPGRDVPDILDSAVF